MKTHFLPAIKLTILCAILFSGIYTCAIWGIAQLSPQHGKGEIIEIGQAFSSDRYFWSRPSAVGYNAAGSAGSNKGPSNPEYLAEVQARIDTFLAHHPGVSKSKIPADLVTAGGSGLDPHISVEAARVQVGRVARVRQLPEDRVAGIVQQYTEGPLIGLFGPSRVNVLKLNLALDEIK